MTDFYFDPVNGADGNPGTIALPKQNFGNIVPVTGNRYFLKRGTVSTLNGASSAFSVNGGFKNVSGVYVGSYGEATVPYATLDQVALGYQCLTVDGCSNITVEDLDLISYGVVDGSGIATQYGMAFSIQAGVGNTSGITARRIRAKMINSKSNGLPPALYNYGYAAFIGSIFDTNTGAFTSSNVTVEDLTAYDSGGYGMVLGGGISNITILRPVLTNNGADIAVQAFSAGLVPEYPSANLTWTNLGGGLYSTQNLTGSAPTLVADALVYRQDTVNPINPAVNTWGWSGQKVYFKTGGPPPGVSICFGIMTNVLVKDGYASGQKIGDLNAGQEGAGFECDNFALNVTFKNCRSEGNYGAGYFFHSTIGCKAIGNFAKDCGTAVHLSGGSLDTEVINNTLIASTTPALPGIIAITGIHDAPIIRNNVVVSTLSPAAPLYGIFADTTQIAPTVDKNFISGYSSSRVLNVTETNAISGDAKLDSAFKPGRTGVLVASGFDTSATIGTLDYLGNYRFKPVSIGAIEPGWAKISVSPVKAAA